MSENLKKLYKTYVKKIKEQNLQNITDYATSEYNRQFIGGNNPDLTQRFNDMGFKPRSFNEIFKSYKKSLTKSLKKDEAFYASTDRKINAPTSRNRSTASSHRAVQGVEKPLTFDEWKINRNKKLELPNIPLPGLKLSEVKKQETDLNLLGGPKYGLSSKRVTEELPGGLTKWEMWFKEQTPGTTAFYPGDENTPPGNFVIEYGGEQEPSLPPSQFSTQQFIFTKDGQQIDMNSISPQMQQKLWNDVKEEYVRTASPNDAVKMFLQEFPNGNWTDFMDWKKESDKARRQNEDLARNKTGEANIFYGTREYDSEGRIVKDELKKQ